MVAKTASTSLWRQTAPRMCSSIPSTRTTAGHVSTRGAEASALSATRYFSTTPTHHARKKGDDRRPPANPKLMNLRQGLRLTMMPPKTLYLDTMRYMRHWTIHRAWQLFRRKQREERERVLMQQYQSMHRACEELRKTAGPGLRDTGYLYRVAMEKKGVYGLEGIPIEYARAQTETPARVAWNHDWKR